MSAKRTHRRRVKEERLPSESAALTPADLVADLLAEIGPRLMRQRADLIAWLSAPDADLTSDRGLRLAALLNDTEGRLIELAGALALSPAAVRSDARMAELERAIRELEDAVASIVYLAR